MILLTGATGRIGREVVNLLHAKGEKATAVVRDPRTAALPDGIRVVQGDSAHPRSMLSALDGIEVLFLVPAALGGNGAELLSLAVEGGVRRVVLISAITVEYGGGEARFSEEFRALEHAVESCGLPWTILRCADFASNSLAWAPQIRAGAVVRGAYAEAATSPIHPRDIAEVAADTLVNPVHAGHSYALTGPRSLTQRAKTSHIGRAIGRDLTFEEISADQVRQAMLDQGLPEDVPARMLGYLADCVHSPGPTTEVVARILGRPARTFADWAAENTEAFGGQSR